MAIGQNRVVPAAQVHFPRRLDNAGAAIGFGRKTPPAGKSSAPTLTRPDIATILIGGHRSRTNRASSSPSIEPGIWISMKTTWIAGRARRIAMATSPGVRRAFSFDRYRGISADRRAKLCQLMCEPIFGHVKGHDNTLRVPIARNRAAKLNRHGAVKHFASISSLTTR